MRFSLQRLWRFARKRDRASVAALVALAAIVATPVAWSYYSANREAAAQARLAGVIRAFNQAIISKSGKEAFEPIIVDAQEIHRDYRPSPATRLAQYYLAMSEESVGHTDRCAQNLQELVREGDPMMKPLAQLALGELYRNHGDRQKAMEIYQQLEATATYSRHGSHERHSHPQGASGIRPSS